MVKYFLVIILFLSNSAVAAPWNLPKDLDDSIAKVSFELDSTWHTVHGTTKNLRGKVWLEDQADFKSVRADITLPVASFDTDNGSRDSKMRRVMHEEQAPTVNFKLQNVKEICDPKTLAVGEECNAVIDGAFIINNLTKNYVIPLVVKMDQSGYSINGKIDLNWAEFGVEDPSILIAKVDPKVTISFNILLNSGGSVNAVH